MRVLSAALLAAGVLWAADEPAGIPRFAIERGALRLTRQAAPWRSIEALGEEAGVWGSVGGTLEAWAYPWKLFDHFELRFSADGGKTFRALRDLVRVQTAAPHLAQLALVDDRFAVTVTLFVPQRLPGVCVLLDIDALSDLVIAARFRPSLAPMHMEKPATLEVSFDAARGELAAIAAAQGLELRVGSSFATGRESLPGGLEELVLRVPHLAGRRFLVPLLCGVSWEGGPSARSTIDSLRTGVPEQIDASRTYYEALLAAAPAVSSPDTDVNEALAWSVVSLAQLRVRNPFLGPGIVSGYGPSGDGTSPRYCWFFDEPTLGSWALLRLGRADLVREAFTFLQRYQRADGKTVHEVAQSLHLQPDFFTTYRYAYVHTDGPVYFLAAYGHYLKSTGDLAFIKEHWSKIRAAFAWCCSVVDPEDGLLAIEPSDWGSAESSFSVGKDTQLEAMWVQALRATAYVADAMLDADTAERCRAMEAKACVSIEAKLWDEPAGRYLWGLDRAGRPLAGRVPHHAIGIWLGSFRPERALECLKTLASAECRADWGVRSLALGDPTADPSAYQTGAVWPVWNAGLLIADFKFGRTAEAYRNFVQMVRARTLDGLGPMPEVLHGRFLKRLGEGVPHQLFSELAVVNGLFDGLLGLQVDVPARRLTLEPHLPATWHRLHVARIPFGSEHADVTIWRTERVYAIDVALSSARPVTVVLRPQLPVGAVVSGVEVGGAAREYLSRSDTTGTFPYVELQHPGGTRSVRIAYWGGIDFAPIDEEIEPGGTSRNLRVIEAGLDGDEWTMTVEGLPGCAYAVEFFTALAPSEMTGGTVAQTSRSGFMAALRAPAGAVPSVSRFVRWKASVRLTSPRAGRNGSR